MKWVVSSLTGPSHARIVFRSTPPRGRCVGHRRGLSQDRKKRALTSTSGHLRQDDAVRRPGLCNHAIASCLDTRREVIRLWREHFFEPRSAGTAPGKAPRRAARGASSSATARTALSQRSACGRWNPEEGLAAAEGCAGRSVRNSIRGPRLGGGPRASTPGDSTTSCTTAPWPWPCLIPQERVPQLGDRLPDSQCEIAGYCSRTRRSNAARQSWDAFDPPGCRWRFGWRCGLRRGLGKAAAYQWTLLPVVGRSCASLLRTNESLHDSAELGDEDASV